MGWALDHVFICCAPGAPQADALLQQGLVEGSGNTHPGQGTANRRFFFAEGGFIELLWVAQPAQACSALTSPTRLWPRWVQRAQGACPFGLAFRATGAVSPVACTLSPAILPALPFDAWAYRPQYLPADKPIWFAQGSTLQEPALFCLGWAAPAASASAQPTAHGPGLGALRRVSVGLPGRSAQRSSAAMRRAVDAGLLTQHAAARHELVLGFDAPQPLHLDLRAALGIVLVGQVVCPAPGPRA